MIPFQGRHSSRHSIYDQNQFCFKYIGKIFHLPKLLIKSKPSENVTTDYTDKHTKQNNNKKTATMLGESPSGLFCFGQATNLANSYAPISTLSL